MKQIYILTHHLTFFLDQMPKFWLTKKQDAFGRQILHF